MSVHFFYDSVHKKLNESFGTLSSIDLLEYT